MKYSKELVNTNVLIIYKDNDKHYTYHFYCKYIIGKIVSYNPSNNTILIEFSDSKKTRKYFTLLDYEDPFILQDKNENRLAYKEPENNKELWYDVYIDNEAIMLLKNNIEFFKKIYVYKHYVLSKQCYRNKTKKSFFEKLLNELIK